MRDKQREASDKLRHVWVCLCLIGLHYGPWGGLRMGKAPVISWGPAPAYRAYSRQTDQVWPGNIKVVIFALNHSLQEAIPPSLRCLLGLQAYKEKWFCLCVNFSLKTQYSQRNFYNI